MSQEYFSAYYHLQSGYQETKKTTLFDSSDNNLSTLQSSDFSSNDTLVQNEHPQSGSESPSSFLNLSSKKLCQRNQDFNENYQESFVGYSENDRPYSSPFHSPKRHAEESIPSSLHQEDSIFDAVSEEYNLQERHEEIHEEAPHNLQNQMKKKPFIIIRPEVIIHPEIKIPSNNSYKLKNAPFLVFNAIKRGLKYYDPARKIYFQSVYNMLEKMTQSQLDDFKNLMYSCKTPGRTFTSFGRYFKKNYQPEIINLFVDVLMAFLANVKDVEKWLEDSTMKHETKQNIIQSLNQLESDFLDALLK